MLAHQQKPLALATIIAGLMYRASGTSGLPEWTQVYQEPCIMCGYAISFKLTGYNCCIDHLGSFVAKESFNLAEVQEHWLKMVTKYQPQIDQKQQIIDEMNRPFVEKRMSNEAKYTRFDDFFKRIDREKNDEYYLNKITKQEFDEFVETKTENLQEEINRKVPKEFMEYSKECKLNLDIKKKLLNVYDICQDEHDNRDNGNAIPWIPDCKIGFYGVRDLSEKNNVEMNASERIKKFNKEGMMPQGGMTYGSGNYFDEELGFTTQKYGYDEKTKMYYFMMLLIFLQKPFKKCVTNTNCRCQECKYTNWDFDDNKNLTPVFRPTNQVWGIAHELGCINIRSFEIPKDVFEKHFFGDHMLRDGKKPELSQAQKLAAKTTQYSLYLLPENLKEQSGDDLERALELNRQQNKQWGGLLHATLCSFALKKTDKHGNLKNHGASLRKAIKEVKRRLSKLEFKAKDLFVKQEGGLHMIKVNENSTSYGQLETIHEVLKENRIVNPRSAQEFHFSLGRDEEFKELGDVVKNALSSCKFEIRIVAENDNGFKITSDYQELFGDSVTLSSEPDIGDDIVVGVRDAKVEAVWGDLHELFIRYKCKKDGTGMGEAETVTYKIKKSGGENEETTNEAESGEAINEETMTTCTSENTENDETTVMEDGNTSLDPERYMEYGKRFLPNWAGAVGTKKLRSFIPVGSQVIYNDPKTREPDFYYVAGKKRGKYVIISTKEFKELWDVKQQTQKQEVAQAIMEAKFYRDPSKPKQKSRGETRTVGKIVDEITFLGCKEVREHTIDVSVSCLHVVDVYYSGDLEPHPESVQTDTAQNEDFYHATKCFAGDDLDDLDIESYEPSTTAEKTDDDANRRRLVEDNIHTHEIVISGALFFLSMTVFNHIHRYWMQKSN